MAAKVLVVFLLVWGVVFPLSEAAAQKKHLVFFTDEHKRNGYLEAITREAFARVGYKIDVKYMPWKRALKEVMDGKHDALMASYYTEERAEKLAYTESIGHTEIVLFKKQGREIVYSTLQDLRPYRIGMIRGAAINKEFDSADYLQKDEVRSPELNIKKLLKGRIDLIVEQRKVILTYLRKQFPQQTDALVALDPPLTISKYYNAFSKNCPNYEQKVNDFNIGLHMIQHDGTYQKILHEHTHP